MGNEAPAGSQRTLSAPKTIRLTVLLAGLTLVASVSVIVLSYLNGADPVSPFRDMAAVADVHPFTSAVSEVGILIWTVAAAVSLFTAAIMRGRGRPDLMRFSLFFGVLSAILALDDQFMLHEEFMIEVPYRQSAYVVLYGGTLIAFLVTQRSLLLDRLLPLFLGALGFLAASTVADTISDRFHVESVPLSLGEDVLKVVGIVLWCAYGLVRSYSFVMGNGAQHERQGNTEMPALSRRDGGGHAAAAT